MMKTVETFSSRSFATMVLYATISTAMLGLPASISFFIQQDAWLIPIIGSITGIPIIFLYTLLARWMPSDAIFDMNKRTFGKVVGWFASFFYILFPLLHFPAIMSYAVTFITHFLLPSTPYFVCYLLCLSIIVFGILCGIEAIARTASLCLLFFFVPLLLLIGLTLHDVDIGYIMPIAHSPIAATAKAFAIYMGNVVCNVVIQLSIFPKHINDKKAAEKALWLGYSFGCLILVVFTFLCITVLTPQVVSRDFYPALSLAQRIDVGQFFQRIEATITVVWFISIYFNLLLYFYAILTGMAHLFNLKKAKPLVLPIAMLLLFLGATYFTNIIEERDFFLFVSIPQSILTGFFLPLFLVAVGLFKRRKKKQPLWPKHAKESTGPPTS
ncbi:hypothetical protein J26TS2_35710 [Shouchella clausii]|nr:hypothetical protein J26TS2_35710 [Shouchella clausii]